MNGRHHTGAGGRNCLNSVAAGVCGVNHGAGVGYIVAHTEANTQRRIQKISDLWIALS